MTLFVHRSNRIEALHETLAGVLSETTSRDPFEPTAVVVGSQGMARWLRYEFATRDGAAARMEFPFSAQALDGAIRWRDSPLVEAAAFGRVLVLDEADK